MKKLIVASALVLLVGLAQSSFAKGGIKCFSVGNGNFIKADIISPDFRNSSYQLVIGEIYNSGNFFLPLTGSAIIGPDGSDRMVLYFVNNNPSFFGGYTNCSLLASMTKVDTVKQGPVTIICTGGVVPPVTEPEPAAWWEDNTQQIIGVPCTNLPTP